MAEDLTEKIKKTITTQDMILKVLYPILPDSCLLTGGTTLTRFYGFAHRFSEDLDFFFFRADEGFKDTWSRVGEWIRSLRQSGFHIEVISAPEESIKKVFHLSFIATTPPTLFPVKVDFVEDVFSGCWLPERMKTVDTGIEFRIDSPEAILHKKLYAVYSNKMQEKEPRTKDVLDICVLFEERFDFVTVQDFYKNARDVVLPFDSIILVISEFKPDYSEIILLDPLLPERFKEWQEEIKVSGPRSKRIR